jgi:hypothetical protein
VLGQGFGTVAADIFVSFTDEDGGVKLASVLAVAPDGTQIQIETPQFSTLPLEEDRVQDVNVSTIDGTTMLEDGFLVLADNPTPVITSVSPISGPLDGGTLVTIFGRGFQVPMQVTFGDLSATDVNVFNDTTPADNDRITCVVPDYSQQGDTPPVAVDVTVTNMTSGNLDTLAGGYTYGDALYISGNTPTSGKAGDLVIIYGSGFEDPLQVFLVVVGSGGDDDGGGDSQSVAPVEVVSVSGTELVVRIPDLWDSVCDFLDFEFKVVLLEREDTFAQGGTFKLFGNQPWVFSVDPVIFQVDNLVDLNLIPDDIRITGQFFNDNLLVTVGSYVVPSSDTDVLSDTTIEVFDLPDLNDLGVVFSTSSCVIPPDIPGQQLTSTSINVTVRNFPGACSNTLQSAMVVEPPSTSCDPTPANIITSPQGTWQFPDTPSGGDSAIQALLVFNAGGEDAESLTFIYAGSEFTPVTDNCPADLPFNDSCSYEMRFSPNGVGAVSEQLEIRWNSATEGPKQRIVTLVGTGTP